MSKNAECQVWETSVPGVEGVSPSAPQIAGNRLAVGVDPGYAQSLEISVPFCIQRLIDGIVRSVSAAHELKLSGLLTSLAAMFVLVASSRLLRSTYNYWLYKTAASLEDEAKSSAFENFLNWDMAALSRSNSGQVIGNLDRGGTAIFVTLYEILGQNLVPPLIVFGGVFASLLLKNPIIAMTVFLPLPIYVLIVGRFTSRMHELEQEVNHGFERVSKECYDIAGNAATVKKFSQESSESTLQRHLLAKARLVFLNFVLSAIGRE